MNKLSLVGMQLPGKYKANFNVSSEGPLSDCSPSLETSNPYERKLDHIIGTTWAHTVQDYITKWSITYSFKLT
jgi:hypothetical protein